MSGDLALLLQDLCCCGNNTCCYCGYARQAREMQAEMERLRAEIDKLAEENYQRYFKIERLLDAGDALAEALTLPFALSSTAARDAWTAWQEARRG